MAENIERRAAQTPHSRQRPEHRHHPGAEGTLLRPPQRVLGTPEDRRREVELDLEVAVELITQLLFELAVAELARDLILVLVGQQLGVVNGNRARQRVTEATIERRVTHLPD